MILEPFCVKIAIPLRLWTCIIKIYTVIRVDRKVDIKGQGSNEIDGLRSFSHFLDSFGLEIAIFLHLVRAEEVAPSHKILNNFVCK